MRNSHRPGPPAHSKTEVLFACALIVWASNSFAGDDLRMPDDFNRLVKSIDAEEMRDWMKNEREFIVLDVRTEKEFRKDGRAPDSVLHPYTMQKKKRQQNIDFLRDVAEQFDKSETLVVLCSHGMRATQAAWELQEKEGFENVYVFSGGFEGHHMSGYPAGDGWKAAGLPMED